MQKYKEKELKKYVIADLSQSTNYLCSLGNAKYCFIDNIVSCTKFISKTVATLICNECMTNFDMDLVVVPLLITYEIIEE